MAGTKLLWLDMEMTGLDVTKEVPLEVRDRHFAEARAARANTTPSSSQPQSYWTPWMTEPAPAPHTD